jgi:hypothetical protein
LIADLDHINTHHRHQVKLCTRTIKPLIVAIFNPQEKNGYTNTNAPAALETTSTADGATTSHATSTSRSWGRLVVTRQKSCSCSSRRELGKLVLALAGGSRLHLAAYSLEGKVISGQPLDDDSDNSVSHGNNSEDEDKDKALAVVVSTLRADNRIQIVISTMHVCLETPQKIEQKYAQETSVQNANESADVLKA